MPDLKQPVVLFRHKDGLGVRYTGELRVNGQAAPERAVLPPVATVAGEDIAFAIEPANADGASADCRVTIRGVARRIA